ncbi:hypothetical protein HY733_01185 [Candidatus Uhrbacteria bacterium]|nr:hypothetical protein [Candidatus Uhrbacteria bacterium]
MSIDRQIIGAQEGETLEVEIALDATDCTPGDKWSLEVDGVILTPNTDQEIPAGATSHTLKWKSDAPLATGLASPLQTKLRKTHGTGAGMVPVRTFQITIRPAAAPSPNPAPAAGGQVGAAPGAGGANPAAAAAGGAVTPPIPQPLQVQVVGSGSNPMDWLLNSSLFLGAGTIVLGILLLYIVIKLLVGSGFHAQQGLSHGEPPTASGKDTVTTTVTQTVESNDPTVLLEAARGSASITHDP